MKMISVRLELYENSSTAIFSIWKGIANCPLSCQQNYFAEHVECRTKLNVFKWMDGEKLDFNIWLLKIQIERVQLGFPFFKGKNILSYMFFRRI